MADNETLEMLKKIDARLERLEQKVNRVPEKSLGDLSDLGENNLELLQRALESLNKLSEALSHIDQAEDIFSILTDTIDEFFSYAMEQGLDVQEFATNTKKFSFLITQAFESGAMADLIESGILEPRTIRTVGALGNSMAASGETSTGTGPINILSAIFNKDIQRSLGFALRFAVHFGQSLESKNVKVIK